MVNVFFVDLLLFLPCDVDCYMQAPDLDNDLVQNLLEPCNLPYYIRIKLTIENKATIINLEFQSQISQWIQSMEIRKGSELLFEGYDSVSYGLFSKKIVVPNWFKKKYVEDFCISPNW